MTRPPPLRAAALAALCGLALASAGCATYQPTSVAELPADQRVRMRLAPEELARHLLFARGGQGYITARFVEARGDSATFLLTAGTAQSVPGVNFGSFSQVTLPRSAILSIERRESATGRSMLLSAALVGGVAVLAYLGFEGGESGVPDSRDDGTDQLVPGMRVVIPLGR